MMLIITGYMHIDPTEVPQFLAELTDLAIVTRRRPGKISYNAALDDPETGRLLIAECWTDERSSCCGGDQSFRCAMAGTHAGRCEEV
jgi:quinol monooxygenase YgiN